MSQSRSSPFEKNLPSPVVTRAAGPSTASTWSSAACRASTEVRLKRFSSLRMWSTHTSPRCSSSIPRLLPRRSWGGSVAVGTLVYRLGVADYRPPLNDISFVLDNLVDLDEICQLEPFAHLDRDTIKAVLEENGRFVGDVIAPLNRIGDEQGSQHQADNSVKTPDGLHRGLQGLRRRRLGRRAVRAGLRRRRVPVARRHRHAGVHLQRQHGVLDVPAAHPGRHRHAAPPRQRGAEGDLPPEDGDRGVDRHR